MKKTQIRNSFLLLLTAVIWGVAFVAQSVSMDYVEPFTFNCIRSIIGGAVLIPCIMFLRKLKEREAGIKSDHEDAVKEKGITEDAVKEKGITGDAVRGKSITGDAVREKAVNAVKEKAANAENEESGVPAKAALSRVEMIGGICCGVALCAASNFQQFGISYTTVGKAGFITALYVVIVPIMGLFFKKKVSFAIWISVVLSVVGLYLLCMTGDSFSLAFGDALVLVCAVLFSIHIMIIDYFSPKGDGVVISCIQFFVCGLLSGVMMFLFETPHLEEILAAKVPILYAGVMSCGVAYTLQIVGQKNMNPTVASLILCLESVVSALAGWLILHQELSARELAGCFLMFFAIVLAQLPFDEWMKKRRNPVNA